MKFDISILCAGMPFDANTLKEGFSLGGSETMALGLAEELGRRGHNVLVFVNHPDPQSDPDSSVRFAQIDHYQEYASRYPNHIAIVQRLPMAFSQKGTADLNILWQHDLPIIEMRDELTSCLWNIDEVVFVSKWHQEQYERVYELADDEHKSIRSNLNVIENAVEIAPAFIEPQMPLDPNRILYTSRPERGLDAMLEFVFPKILELNPDAELHICTYDNPNDRTAPIVERCKQLGAAFGKKVVWLPPLGKNDLHDLMRASGVLCYPCPSPAMREFAEVSCITYMEAMQAGMGISTTRWGASRETLKGYSGARLAEAFDWDAIAENTVKLQKRRAKGEVFGGGRDFSWAEAGDKWMELIEAAYEEKRSDPTRIFHHCLRRSELDICFHLKEQGLLQEPELEILERDYGWTQSPELLAAHYSAFTDDTNAHLEKSLEAGRFSKEYLKDKSDEPRFGHILHHVKEHYAKMSEGAAEPPKLKLLDYGCGHGWFASFALLNCPWLEYHGVDFDPNAIDFAKKVTDFCGVGDRAHFKVAADYQKAEEFDFVVCSEVMEHVLDVNDLIARVEGSAKRGGRVLWTTPWGPTEFGTHNWIACRQHLREITRPDLTAMFGEKKFEGSAPIIEFMPEGINARSGDPWGHYLITYLADHIFAPYPSQEERLRYIAPRGTLSTMMIAGGDVEETLEWSLKSTQWISDEILIGDNGMSERSREIALRYGAKLIDVPSPMEIGFGPCRNLVLDRCRMDWVLWIDDDEKFVDPEQLPKYLRAPGYYRGWSIHQHHFGVDVDRYADLPVRCFHRTTKPENRFNGLVHEHPEYDEKNGPGRIGRPGDLHLMHIGYENEKVRQGRFWRNAPLMERDIKENPNRKLQVQLICRDAMIMAQRELELTGGQINEFILNCAKQTVATFRERFLGKDWGLVEVSPVPYYSQAARLLGGEITARINIEVSRRGRGDHLPSPGDDPDVICFASLDDLRKFLDKEIEGKLKDLEGPAWDALTPP